MTLFTVTILKYPVHKSEMKNSKDKRNREYIKDQENFTKLKIQEMNKNKAFSILVTGFVGRKKIVGLTFTIVL